MSVGILFYVFTRPDVDLQKLFEAVRTLSPVNFVCAFLIYGLVITLACLRWLVLLKSFGIRIAVRLVFQLHFIGLFFNNMMPSLTGGDVVKGYYIARGSTKKVEAVVSIFLDRFFGVFAIFLLAVVSALFALDHNRLGPLAKIILLFVGLFLVGLFLFLSLPFWKRFSLLQKFLDRFIWASQIKRIYNALTALRPKQAAVVLLMSLLIQSLLVVLNYILAVGLGIKDISLGQFFVLIPIAGFISALPISFAGWGVGEGAYRALFMIMNPAYGGIAVVLSILYRFICLVYSLIGFPLYLIYRHEPIEEVSSPAKASF
jgi:uncharacterized protein (TIRG00374 family)